MSDEAAPVRGPGRRGKRWIALLVALAAAALAGELWVRIWIGAPLPERLPLVLVRANPLRAWEMVPSTEHYTYRHRVRVNSLGLRGPELGPKEPGERRVLVLGDSLTYGQGVADDETVPAALESALRARDPRPWTVVNGGVRAYGTGQELGLLAELGERIAPDWVLLGWYWNDLLEGDVRQRYEELRGKGEFYFDTNDRLEGLGRLRWYAKELTRRSALVMFAHDVFAPSGRTGTAEEHAQGLARLAGQLAELRSACARLGARPVFLLFPDRYRLAGSGFTVPLDERASAAAREQGLPVIELLPALVPLRAATGRIPTIAFDGHYDADANRAMAERAAEELLALERAPRTE